MGQHIGPTAPDQTLIVAETEEQGIVGFLHAGGSREPEMGCDYELYAVYLLAEVQEEAGAGCCSSGWLPT